MKSRSKRSAQLALDLLPPAWGGKREGAGAKKTGTRRDPLHRVRPVLGRNTPVHVVMRVKKSVPRLRQRRVYDVVRHAMNRLLGDPSFQICHVSIQGNHLHYLVEAVSKDALRRGMQRLNIIVAKSLNRELRRRGKVFEFRYHATQITSPRQTRNALAYVLNNWRRHREDTQCELLKSAKLDRFSSAVSFDGWRGITFSVPTNYDPLPVCKPRTWLLRTGWRKHGEIDVYELPGAIRAV